jgi:hypothetical protein
MRSLSLMSLRSCLRIMVCTLFLRRRRQAQKSVDMTPPIVRTEVMQIHSWCIRHGVGKHGSKDCRCLPNFRQDRAESLFEIKTTTSANRWSWANDQGNRFVKAATKQAAPVPSMAAGGKTTSNLVALPSRWQHVARRCIVMKLTILGEQSSQSHLALDHTSRHSAQHPLNESTRKNRQDIAPSNKNQCQRRD